MRNVPRCRTGAAVVKRCGVIDTSLMKRLPGLLLLASLSCPVPAGGLDPWQGFEDAPPLSLRDIADKVHTLGDHRGRVVLVNFWASWCAPCIVEMPAMQRLLDAMTGKPFSILAVNVGESPGKVWNFASRLGIRFPLLLDPDGDTAAGWQVDVYPSSFLIDPQGRIRYAAHGPRDWDAPGIIQTIEELLAP